MNEETAALLRVMVYTQNNTAFGGQVPTVPQPWTGPPRSIVQVQAILLASLFTSLLSAFLAMLGKQWLNRCMPVDTRGTIIQRSQHRQRKFDGIINWYFDNVMEALPLMLQVALLLLGCALSRYLWEINTTVASVVLGFTAFGLLFYVFIVIAGAVSGDCPYQTPVANFLRYTPVAISHTLILLYRSAQSVLPVIQSIPRRIPPIFRCIRDALQRVPSIFHHHSLSIFRRHPLRIFRLLRLQFSIVFRMLRSQFSIIFITSNTLYALEGIYHTFGDLLSINCSDFFEMLITILILPVLPIADLCMAIIWALISFTNWVRQDQLGQHTKQTTGHIMDLRCVLWTLQTSVGGPTRQSALEYLATITMDDFDPTQAVACWFGIFLNCIQVTNGSVAIIQGCELLAEKYSLFCLHVLSHVVVAGPMPKALEGVRREFAGAFPPGTNFGDPPISYPLAIIYSVFSSSYMAEGLDSIFLAEGPMHPVTLRKIRWQIQWNNYRPSSSEYTIVTPALVKFAQFGYKRSGERAKVPRWLLRFALHSLSQDPLPPPSVVSDSLSIIAIDLECGDLDTVTADPLDRR